ncbi:fimbria/pilus outer membrane usher protein [Enterobacter ludwigii]
MKLKKLVVYIITFLPCFASAGIYFDPSMLSGENDRVVDLTYFTSGRAQLPGVYTVDIYVNNNKVATQPVQFNTIGADNIHSSGDNSGLEACLTEGILSGIGVSLSALSKFREEGHCINVSEYFSGGYSRFNSQKMRLDLSIPQASLQKVPRGWIPPEQWDDGINAALLSWQFSGNESRGRYSNSRSQFLNLTSGINIGAWRLRDNSTWSRYENRYSSQHQWHHLNTYMQRAIIPWRSDLSIGDSTTGSDIFDPVSFRGIQLVTDDRMYPDTMRGFAPVIKGIAGSNATVSIRQNGNVIYRTSVAPGAFVIDDLYPLSTGGDLDVSVISPDGSEQTFTVPYSSVPVLQREGRYRYGMTVGRYRNTSNSYADPLFAQSTVLWGLPNDITVYGGTQLAEKYRAVAAGAGINMGLWGAISADVTHSNSTLSDGSKHDGQSIRFLYGRSLVSTGTSFRLAGYRFSTRGFYSLSETALKRMSGWTNDDELVDAAGRPLKNSWANYYNLHSNKRERLQASISQKIGALGTLYLTGNRQTYWDDSATTSSLQTGFSSSIGQVSYNLAYGYSRYSGQPAADKTAFISFSVPLENLLTGKSQARNLQTVHATYSSNRDSDGHITHQAGLNGTSLEGGNLSWNVAQGYGRRDGGSGDAGIGYQGTYGNASLGYGYSRNYRQLRYATSGSAVLHEDGLTIGQPLGNTNVLISAPGAVSVPVENSTGVRTDWRGYTIMPYASMYRENRIALDISKLDDHTDIDNAVSRTVPTRGALVRAKFNTRTGTRALVTLLHNGKPLSFGTMVTSADGTSNGIAGENGEVYLSGLASHGELIARWGEGSNEQCAMKYIMDEKNVSEPLVRFVGVCI